MIKILKYARFLVFLCCLSLLSIMTHAQDTHDPEQRYREVLRFGRGSILWADWHPNGQQIVVFTQTDEAWLYTVPDFDVLLHLKDVDWGWFSPDGRWLIARRPDISFALYDAVSFSDTPMLDNLELPLFSPDNRYVLIHPIDGEASIRPIDDIQTIITLPDVFLEPDMWLAWRPDANVLTGITSDSAVITWDVDSDLAPQTISLQGASVLTKPEWSPDGTRLLAHDADKKIVMWDAVTGARLLEIPDAVAFEFTDYGLPHFQWSSDSRYFVRNFYGLSGTPEAPGLFGFGLYDAQDGHAILERHEPDITPPRFSPDGSYFSFGYGIYRTANAETVLQRYGAEAYWRADGRYVVIPGVGIDIIDMQTRESVFFIDFRPNTSGGNAQWSPDGSHLLSWEYGGSLVLWDTASWEKITQIDDHINPVRKVAFSPDSTLIAGADIYGTVRLWDTTTFELRHTIHAHHSDLTHLEWQPGGRLLATTTGDVPVSREIADDGHFAYIWDGDTGEIIATQEHTDYVTDVAWSPNGRYFASGSRDSLKIWDTVNHEMIFDQPVGSIYFALLSWSPDSSIIVADIGGMSHGGFNIMIWDVKTGEKVGGRIAVNLNRPIWTPDARKLLGLGTRCTDFYPSRNCAVVVQLLFDRSFPTPDRDGFLPELPGYSFGTFATLPGILPSPTRDHVFIREATGTAALWQFDDIVATLIRAYEGVTNPVWSPDGNYIALTIDTSAVHVIDSQTGESILVLDNVSAPSWRLDERDLHFFVHQPSETYLPGPIEQWDITTGERIGVSESIIRVWSNDGRLWAEAYTGILRLWNEE